MKIIFLALFILSSTINSNGSSIEAILNIPEKIVAEEAFNGNYNFNLKDCSVLIHSGEKKILVPVIKGITDSTVIFPIEFSVTDKNGKEYVSRSMVCDPGGFASVLIYLSPYSLPVFEFESVDIPNTGEYIITLSITAESIDGEKITFKTKPKKIVVDTLTQQGEEADPIM